MHACAARRFALSAEPPLNPAPEAVQRTHGHTFPKGVPNQPNLCGAGG